MIAVEVTPHRFTVEDYHKMAEAGILTEDDRVELIEGEIVEMAPIGRRHMASVDRFTLLLVRALSPKAIVRVGGAVRLSGFTEPQPDLILLRPQADFYPTADAAPSDVLLVVEVADSSLAYDRRVKAPLYVRLGVPEYWIADLNGTGIIVHREPGPDGYRQIFVVRGSETFSPEAFPEFALRAEEVLPCNRGARSGSVGSCADRSTPRPSIE